MASVFVADEISTPTSRGGFKRFRPGRLKLSKQGRILSVEKISAAKLQNLSKKNTKRVQTIVPGLIDAHTHLVFGGQRSGEWNKRLSGVSYEKIYEEGGGIRSTVRSTCEAKPAELLALAKRRVKRAISYGVTTLEMKSGYGLDLKNEIKILKVMQKLKKASKIDLIATFLGAHALKDQFASTDAYTDYLIETVLPKVKGLAEFQDVFCERGYFTKTQAIRILEEGKRYGLKPKVHANEFGRTGGVEAACEVSAVSADHLQHMNAADFRAMKKAGVIPVVLPGTSLFLGGKEFAPARQMWDAGLKVAIASDFNPGTNPSQNFALHGTLAAIYEGLNLEEVLTAQTWHGALALDRKDRGVIEKGMRADFVCLETESFEEMYYSYGDSRVSAVYSQGKKVS